MSYTSYTLRIKTCHRVAGSRTYKKGVHFLVVSLSLVLADHNNMKASRAALSAPLCVFLCLGLVLSAVQAHDVSIFLCVALSIPLVRFSLSLSLSLSCVSFFTFIYFSVPIYIFSFILFSFSFFLSFVFLFSHPSPTIATRMGVCR